MPLPIEDLRNITRARRAWELWTEGGLTQKQIAIELGLAQSTVSHWLRRFEERFLAECRESVERVKARQTARLDHIAREATRAWEKSKSPTYRQRRKSTPKGPEFEETLTGSSGDPRFLEQAQKAMAEVRRIWGIDRDGDDDARKTLAEIADEMDTAAAEYRPDEKPR